MLQISYQTELIEAGCDEAGRGSLAGAVYAAAVILPKGFADDRLNDSKKLTPKARFLLRDVIVREAVAWAVGVVTQEEIDRMNILNASFEAMSRAVEQLKVKPELLLIDGNRFRPRLSIPYRCEVKGDGRFANIAAASILAKTFRDEYMLGLAEEYPMYEWDKNMGYPTKAHRQAILEHGLSPYHRLSFNCTPEPTLFDSIMG